jgi:tRNA modification GTPase
LDATSQDYNKTISNLIDENCIIVINKIDLTDQSIPEIIFNHPVLGISVQNNTGIDQLMSKITSFTTNFFAFADNEPLITKQRQRENLTKTLQCLKNFSLEQDLVLATEELRMAANYLGSITGRIDVESILGEIFSSFCIGK